MRVMFVPAALRGDELAGDLVFRYRQDFLEVELPAQPPGDEDTEGLVAVFR